tara:strand:- start:374 stop:790 length:417 start_codon:yes stop_codon:yes gene_type:complete
MFNNGELSGILLTIARPEITSYQSNTSKTGWNIRVRIMFRASHDFLLALERKFKTLDIDCNLRTVEGPNRKAPVLIVGKRAALNAVRELMNKNLPCSHADWRLFDAVSEEISEKNHLEEEGMNRIREMMNDENYFNEI